MLNQVYEAVYSLNSKPELKQAGLGICCSPPALFLLAVLFWSVSVFVQRVIKISDPGKEP